MTKDLQVSSLKECLSSLNFWVPILIVAVPFLGFNLSGPASSADLNSHIIADEKALQDHIEVDLKQYILLEGLEKEIIQVQIDQVTRSIWQQEDRNVDKPSLSGKDRERELYQQRDKLEERKRKIK